MKRNVHTLPFVFGCILLGSMLLLGPMATAQTQEEKDATTLLKAGNKAADFTVDMLDGSRISLSQLKGKVVLLNFWATWCPPCMQEFAALPEKIVKRFEGRDFVLLPISRGETRDTVLAKMEQLKAKGIDFPVGLDPKKAIYSLYATQYVPRSFVIDKEGNIVMALIGYTPKELEEVANTIEKLLK